MEATSLSTLALWNIIVKVGLAMQIGLVIFHDAFAVRLGRVFRF